MQRNNYPTSSNYSYYNSSQPSASYSYQPTYASQQYTTTPQAGYSQQSYAASPMMIALQNLQTRIYNALQRNAYDKMRSEILNHALTALGNVQVEAYDNALLLDLYLTINSVFDICGKHSDFNAALKKFFGQREELLRGDSHDYCYSQSLANQFCQRVAKTVFPHKNPLNVLLENALANDRREIWQDVTTLDNSLDSPGEFFRTKDNCIHLYQAVVERAIGILKRGYFDINEIWRGTDVKNLKSLNNESLLILKQRSPTLRQLIEHTETLNKGAGFITKKFAEWRCGLKAGVRNNGPEDLEADKASYKANKEFFEWWNELPKSTKGQAIRNKINQISELGAFIKTMSSKDSINNCVDGYQMELEELLGRYRDELKQIDQPQFQSDFSNNELDQLKQVISRELDSFCTIKTNQNVFAELCQKKDLMDRLAKRPEYVTYSDISYKIASVVKPSPKPVPSPKLFNDESIQSKPVVNQQMMPPSLSAPSQPTYQQAYQPVQKHGLFKHFREKREEKKIQKQFQKLGL